MERGIAQILGSLRAMRPGEGDCVEKTFVGVTHPKTWFGREPIKLPQPLRGRIKSWIIENFRFVRRGSAWFSKMPFVPVPLPQTLVTVAAAYQPEANRFIREFEDKLGPGGMRHAKLFPIRALLRSRPPQLSQETVGQFLTGKSGVWTSELSRLAEGGLRRR
jgi:hypothetical protein